MPTKVSHLSQCGDRPAGRTLLQAPINLPAAQPLRQRDGPPYDDRVSSADLSRSRAASPAYRTHNQLVPERLAQLRCVDAVESHF
jgi:hypothetical protein